MKKIIIAWVCLFFVCLSFLMTSSRTKPAKLPNFEKYMPDSTFDLGACQVYNPVPYMGWYDDYHMTGYCSITNYLTPPLRFVSLMLNGNIIRSASFEVDDSVQLQQFFEAWGFPERVRNWSFGTQFAWKGKIIYLKHKVTGRNDENTIRWIYLYTH